MTSSGVLGNLISPQPQGLLQKFMSKRHKKTIFKICALETSFPPPLVHHLNPGKTSLVGFHGVQANLLFCLVVPMDF